MCLLKIMTDAKVFMLFANDFITNKDVMEANTKLYEFLSLDDNIHTVLKKHFTIRPIDQMATMSESTLTDMQLDIWCEQQGHSMGGRDLFYQMVSSPTTDIALLKKRQESIRKVNIEWQTTVQKLALLEKDVLWIYTLPDTFDDVWPIPLLFPSFPLVNRVNHYSRCLTLYHVYRIWMTPILQLVIPILSILGPWLYLRFRMKWKLKITEYFQLLKFLLVQSMAGADWKQKASKYFTIAMYGFIFLYGFIQTIDISRMLYIVKNKLLDRVKNIRKFIDESYSLLSLWNVENVEKPQVPEGMAGVYALWTDRKLRNDITKLVQRFYELDVSIGCKLLVTKDGWSFAKYGTTDTLCQALRNPLLHKKQVSNPVFLSKNLIITGPNAAGKSTYVRSIGANIICAQTLGICCAKRAQIRPVHAILSYMRIRDLIGDKSLFQTEVEHCSRIIQAASEIQKAGKSAVIFFDEPMHSTPALEGEAAAYAVLDYLGKMNDIRTIVTSHYHRITRLALDEEHKKRWANLCMDAVYDEQKDTYSFPYRIRPGASFQSIALELLRGTEQLPASIVQNAIKFKSHINN